MHRPSFSIDLLVRWLTFLFFLTSGITWVVGEPGKGVLGRATVGDAVGLAILILFATKVAVSSQRKFALPREYQAYLPLLTVFAVGAALSANPGQAIIELAIHVFIFSVSLALFNLQGNRNDFAAARRVLTLALLSTGTLAIFALISHLAWPSLVEGSYGGLTGTFRNSGQAGTFFGLFVAVLLPGFLCGLVDKSLRNILLFLAIVAALLLTIKRAALIGAVLGLFLLSITLLTSGGRRDKRYGLALLVVAAVAAPLITILLQWGAENIAGMAWRIEAKFNEDVVESFSEGFLRENVEAAIEAFFASPLIGVGLGNVAGVFTAKYEIHSTYLAIIACAGAVGVVTYLFFIVAILARWVRSSGSSIYGMYIRYFVPMLVGLLVSWAYTYHLRKREFWILVFVLSLMADLARRYRSARHPLTSNTA